MPSIPRSENAGKIQRVGRVSSRTVHSSPPSRGFQFSIPSFTSSFSFLQPSATLRTPSLPQDLLFPIPPYHTSGSFSVNSSPLASNSSSSKLRLHQSSTPPSLPSLPLPTSLPLPACSPTTLSGRLSTLSSARTKSSQYSSSLYRYKLIL